MVISKPCNHPACPQREGFIRGQYESIEFIREIPQKPKRASSYGDLGKTYDRQPLDKQAIIRQAENASGVSEGRPRGKTVSFAESQRSRAKQEAHDLELLEADLNPVEWIMITRSDPGGSVPRFMVERGTPGGIVSDAGKFLDWACKETMPTSPPQEQIEGNEEDVNAATKGPHDEMAELDVNRSNGHMVDADRTVTTPQTQEDTFQTIEDLGQQEPPPSMLASITSVAYDTLSHYTPQAVLDRLPTPTPGTYPQNSVEPSPSSSRHSSTTSINSFASARSGPPKLNLPDSVDRPASLDGSCLSIPTQNRPASSSDPTQDTTIAPGSRPPSSNYEKQIQKLEARKTSSELKLAQTRKALLKSHGSRSRSSSLQSSQSSSQAPPATPEKHVQELAQAEARHAKELASIEEKRAKEAKKEADRQTKELERKLREEEKRKASEAREEEKRKRHEQRDEARRRKEEFVEERRRLELENRELKEKVAVLEKEGKVMRGVLEEAHREILELKIKAGVRAMTEGIGDAGDRDRVALNGKRNEEGIGE